MPKISRLISSYKNISLFTKIFIYLRWITTPFHRLEELVGRDIKILDVGSSHAIFDLYLLEKSKKRRILAIDPSKEKIEVAKKMDKPNVSFRELTIDKLDAKEQFDLVMFIDVLYLFPEEEKIRLLKKAKKLLKRNGEILLNSIAKSNSPIYYLIYLQEYFSVVISKNTYSSFQRIYFTNQDEDKRVFKKAGLKIVEHFKERKLFYPYNIYILKK